MKRAGVLFIATALAGTVAATDSRQAAAPLDMVARVGEQTLTGERLARVVARSDLPLQKEIVAIVVDLWVNYQLIGLAGARGDSLADTTVIDGAMWATLDSARATKFFEVTQRSVPPLDTTNLAARYLQSDALAAEHILISVPDNASLQSQNLIRQRAESLLRRVTNANFKQMAAQYTDEPGGKERSGNLGVFARGAMLPEFENAVRALRPGTIGTALVKTSYGYHIIRRPPLSEVRAAFVAQLQSQAEENALKGFETKLEGDYKLTVKPGIAPRVREVVANPAASLGDKTVLATSTLGDFTAGSMGKWLLAFSKGQQDGLKAELASAPDSVAGQRVRMIAAKELVVLAATRNGVRLDRRDVAEIRGIFKQMVFSASHGLKVEPKTLEAAARPPAERERIARSRADSAFDQAIATNGRNFVDVPMQLATALRRVYPWRVNSAALTPIVERAKAVRMASDSLRAKGGG